MANTWRESNRKMLLINIFNYRNIASLFRFPTVIYFQFRFNSIRAQNDRYWTLSHKSCAGRRSNVSLLRVGLKFWLSFLLPNSNSIRLVISLVCDCSRWLIRLFRILTSVYCYVIKQKSKSLLYFKPNIRKL